MRVRAIIGWLVFLMVYITVGIPVINSYLLPLTISWINDNQSMFIINYSMMQYTYNSSSGLFEGQPQVVGIDLRGFIVWLIQVAVYIFVPLAIIVLMIRS